MSEIARQRSRAPSRPWHAAGIRVVRQSSLYATEPVDAPPQAWFLNAVVEAETIADAAAIAARARARSSATFGRRRIDAARPAHAGSRYPVLRLERDSHARSSRCRIRACPRGASCWCRWRSWRPRLRHPTSAQDHRATARGNAGSQPGSPVASEQLRMSQYE